MKKVVSLAVAAAAIPALFGPSFAETGKPATPPAATTTDAAPKAAKPEAAPAHVEKHTAKATTLMAEVVATDPAGKLHTMKHVADKKTVQTTFTVDEGATAGLAQLKPGDHVKVTYEQMGDKRVAKHIVKG